MSPTRNFSIIYDVLGLLTLSIFMAVDSREIIVRGIAVSEQFRISKLAGGSLSNLIGISSSYSLKRRPMSGFGEQRNREMSFFSTKTSGATL